MREMDLVIMSDSRLNLISYRECVCALEPALHLPDRMKLILSVSKDGLAMPGNRKCIRWGVVRHG